MKGEERREGKEVRIRGQKKSSDEREVERNVQRGTLSGFSATAPISYGAEVFVCLVGWFLTSSSTTRLSWTDPKTDF